jgi:excisionase family DNA binding protein
MSELVVIEVDTLKNIIADEIGERITSMLDKIVAGPVLPQKFLTQKELCSYLQISRWTISTLKKKKVIPFLEIGSETRFDLSKVIAALERNSDKVTPISKSLKAV